MALNPLLNALKDSGLRAFHQESPFKFESEAALGRLSELRSQLAQEVRRGNLTTKVAREQAAVAVALVREELSALAKDYSPVPRLFLDRLIDASNARKRAREHMSIEGLQRETNRLLRQTLIEQQLQTRKGEFEAKTFVRRQPGSQPVPTLDTLLQFHDAASNAGDDAAMEWTRRQLEVMRPQVVDPADQRRIDVACDRPDAINPRIVGSYVQTLAEFDVEAMELFVDNAIDSRDANACVASFLLARETEGAMSVRWVRKLLNNLGAFPESALSTLRTLEAECRDQDQQAARAHVDFALNVAETHARMIDLETPSDFEIERDQRIRSRPVAKLGEELGLTLNRRGAFAEELADESVTSLDGDAGPD